MTKIDKFKLIDLAKKAGIEILKIYSQDFDISYKEDQSPVTKADIISNDIICNGLKGIIDIPIISEEIKNIYKQEDLNFFWIVDPLDGTKDFIRKNDEFAINIALIKNNQPIFGMIYAPALNEIYIAQKDEGAFFIKNNIEKKISIKKTINKKMVINRHHFNEKTTSFALKNNITEVFRMGSSLKFAKVAMGDFSIYLRYVDSSEWDIASGWIIIKESGGVVIDLKSKKEMIFNKKKFLNNEFIVLTDKNLIKSFNFN